MLMTLSQALMLSPAAVLACSSDMDCSLNGLCVSGACQCDDPWIGDDCALLSFEAGEPGGIYGYNPNVTSWGGNIVEDDAGMHHLFVAQIDGGLNNWQHQSKCVHATSSRVQGPFEFSDVAIGEECHNPAPIRDPVSGEYLLFHIGSGDEHGSSFMHHSSSPNGPWHSATTSPGSCNNPSAEFHPNGTLFVVCGSGDLSSTSDWNGTWSPRHSMGRHPAGWEDANLWFDRRGNFHVIYHVWTKQPWPANRYSAHAFSKDGWNWNFSDVDVYNGTLDFTDGSSKTFATLERPKFIFKDATHSTPVAVINGASPQPVGADECGSCRSGWCSSCKQTVGRDWTYTVLRPLKGFKDSRFAATLV